MQESPAPREMSSLKLIHSTFFTWKGRMSRAAYWRNILAIHFPLSFLLIFFSLQSLSSDPEAFPIWESLAFILTLFWIPWFISVEVQRLHDFNANGAWVLIFPVVYIAGAMTIPYGERIVLSVMVIMGCIRGTDGTNRFGPDPIAKRT